MVGRLFGARLATQAGEASASASWRPSTLLVAITQPGAWPLLSCRRRCCRKARASGLPLASEIDRSPYGNGLGGRLAD